MRRLAAILCAGALGAAIAAEEPGKNPVPSPAASGPLSRATAFNGTLGEQRIQMQIRPKADEQDGVEGEYFVFGQSRRILLAGEVEGDALFMEESEDGTNVSGQWEGRRQGDAISGTWTSADGSSSKPFALKALVNDGPGGKAGRSGANVPAGRR